MKAATRLFIVLFVAATSAYSAESTKVIVSHAGSLSFSMEVPEGWDFVKSECKACYQIGDRLFELVPSGAKFKGNMTVVYYPGKVPIAAQRYIEGLTYDGNVELPRIDGASAWTLYGKYGRRDGKIGTAYYQTGGGTLAIDMSANSDDQVATAIVTVLRSFKELGPSK